MSYRWSNRSASIACNEWNLSEMNYDSAVSVLARPVDQYELDYNGQICFRGPGCTYIDFNSTGSDDANGRVRSVGGVSHKRA